jgi:hypothetical protein
MSRSYLSEIRGFDGDWNCKGGIGNRFMLDKLSVSCEGYESPQDPYILIGSCTVKNVTHTTVNNSYEMFFFLVAALSLMMFGMVFIAVNVGKAHQKYRRSTG